MKTDKVRIYRKRIKNVLRYIEDNIQQIQNGTLSLKKDYRKIRMTLDNYNDLILIKKFLEKMKKNNKLFNYKIDDIIEFANSNRKLFKKNFNKKVNKKIINTNFDWEKLL